MMEGSDGLYNLLALRGWSQEELDWRCVDGLHGDGCKDDTDGESRDSQRGNLIACLFVSETF